MTVYVRHIHKISQNPEMDTDEAPRTFKMSGSLRDIWDQLVRTRMVGGSLGHHGGHRFQDGGAVFFVGGRFHSVIVMPEGSDLHLKHAPPSHFAEGGPLFGRDPK